MSKTTRAFLKQELERVEAELARTSQVLRQTSAEYVSLKEHHVFLQQALRGGNTPALPCSSPELWVG